MVQLVNDIGMSEIILDSENFRDIVSHIRIYDLEESFKASGYPMANSQEELESQDIERALIRAEKLNKASKASSSDSHINFLKGVRVSFDLTLTNKVWVEAERYHFFDIVSSQSTMHRISTMEASFHERVSKVTIEEVNRLRSLYLSDLSRENYLNLLYNIPSGLFLTARISTNYMCLRNIYNQRFNHRLEEWVRLCNWIKSLPNIMI